MAKLLPLPPACDLYRLLIPLLLLLTISMYGHAIPSQKGGPVTYSAKDVKLRDVFKEIKKQTGYSLMYSNKKVPLNLDELVSVNFNKSNIQDVMEYLLRGKNLQWQLDDESILIFLKSSTSEQKQNESDTSGRIPTMSGHITDAIGEPLEGVSVHIKGTQKGTATNSKGDFFLTNVSLGSSLIISNVGYESREVIVKGKTLQVLLNVLIKSLDETIVIGYGTTTQRFSTGNVSTIKAKDIERQAVTNPLLAIQGRVPGLLITQNTGVANGAVTVRIQGQNSIRPTANEPLVVIDGMPYPSRFDQTGFGGPITAGTATDGTPLSFINPSEIESIDVLKDADATAIYGSRGANGVILITTKKGKPGKTKISIDFQQGWGKVARKVNMLDTRQYLDMRYEAFTNDGIDWRDPSVSANDLKLWDTTRYTDWQKQLIGGTAQYTNINMSVSGGTETIQYLVGATYNRNTAVFPGNFDDKRGAVHFNINGSSLNRKFRIQLSGNYMADNNRLPQIDLTQKAILLEPVAPALHNADGSLNWELNASGNASWDNPLVYTKFSDYNNSTKNLISNAKVSYTVIPGLDILSSFGYSNLHSNIFIPTPLESIRPNRRPFTPRSASYGSKDFNSWIIEPQISFRRNIGQGKLDALIGMTIQQNNNNQQVLTGSGYTSDGALKNIRSAPNVTVPFSSNLVYKYNALFGRLNYNIRDKYIINLTARRDGSSRFGEKTRFHNFGSIGGAWIFTQEKFLQENLSFLSFGKLRASYGTIGSDQIGDYSYLNLYYNTFAGLPYQGSIGLDPLGLPNPYIQWEETKKFQIGVDLGFFNERLIVNATFARNRSSNQILQYALPTVTGFAGITSNFPATVQNINWEVATQIAVLKGKELNWSTNINLTIPKNKVAEFPNIEETTYASGFDGVIVGQPLGVQKLLQYKGVDPATGLYQVFDKKGTPIEVNGFPIFPDDYTVLVNTQPRLYGGFQNSLNWKGFQLDFLFQFVRQVDTKSLYFYNEDRIPGSFGTSRSNQPVTVLNRWRKSGDVTSHARFNTDQTVLPWVTSSDANYSYAASFIRLKNVALSWHLPSDWLQKLKLQNVKLYLQGQNLATITNYTGLDPETKSASILPPLRVISAGIQVEL